MGGTYQDCEIMVRDTVSPGLSGSHRHDGVPTRHRDVHPLGQEMGPILRGSGPRRCNRRPGRMSVDAIYEVPVQEEGQPRDGPQVNGVEP